MKVLRNPGKCVVFSNPHCHEIEAESAPVKVRWDGASCRGTIFPLQLPEGKQIANILSMISDISEDYEVYFNAKIHSEILS
jgi:hypothetical protein